jgi:hypothetical protein
MMQMAERMPGAFSLSIPKLEMWSQREDLESCEVAGRQEII